MFRFDGSQNKLPLVKSGLKMLVEQFDETTASPSSSTPAPRGSCLPPTAAISGRSSRGDRTPQAGGSTNGGAGIQLAYQTAAENFIAKGANRVILCTDGDFNVGVTSQDELIRLIEDKARSEVFLTVLGFGMGNYKDSTMEKLADKGNGIYGYIDTFNEARSCSSINCRGR